MVTTKYVAVHCILVDEAQFLSASLIDQLRRFASEFGIPVICYGLRADFRTKLFEGSQRLLELADEKYLPACSSCYRAQLENRNTKTSSQPHKHADGCVHICALVTDA